MEERCFCHFAGFQVKDAVARAAVEKEKNDRAAAIEEEKSERAKVVEKLNRIVVTPQEFGAIGDGVADDTQAIQNAINNTPYGVLFFPAGVYKITSAITCKSAVNIEGAGIDATRIEAHGCHGFEMLPQWGCEISNLTIWEAGFTKTKYGIYLHGTAPAPDAVNKSWISCVAIRGFDAAVCLSFAWGVVIDKLSTLTCNKGVLLYGQSVNNVITNSNICNETGGSCIEIQKTPEGKCGEGLMISNCVIAQGEYGIKSENFLSLTITNCVIDLITKNAFNLTNVKCLAVDACWVYSNDISFLFNALGEYVDQKAKVSNCQIESKNSNAIKIYGNNGNISFVNNTIEGAGAYVVYFEGGSKNNSFYGNHILSTETPSIMMAGAGNSVVNNTGNVTFNNVANSRGNVYGNSKRVMRDNGYYSTIPDSGEWSKGDIILFESPHDTGYIGAVCTIAGTPGTWKKFGALAD